jgi:RNA polymerase sigma-70 factor (ECF subfamily)
MRLSARLYLQKATGRRNLQAALKEKPDLAIPTELEDAFRAHNGMVFRTAYRITGNAADAEDVLQVVFLRLLRRAPDAEALDNQESYLRRAAINAALDVIRSRKADRMVELTGDVPHHDMSELRRALSRALAQLKPNAAEMFILRFLEGFTNSEIARLLGISQVLVAVTVHRARKQLRNELRGYLGDRP